MLIAILINVSLLLPILLVQCVSNHPLVLIISFDGFRYDYYHKNVTPNLEKLKIKGTHAPYVRNVFPTKTYPNHQSIATGLFTEAHGVIANSFYDPSYQKVVQYSEEMWNFGNDSTPIWILNELTEESRHSGVYMWPGGDFQYHNTRPTFFAQYNTSVEWKFRMDTVLSWFTHKKTPANLVMMYIEEPDSHAHKFGPESKVVLKQLSMLDNITKYLYCRLIDNNLTSVMNVVILSDHGMATVTSDHIYNITKSMSNKTIIAGSSPVLHVVPDDDEVDNVYDDLKRLSQNSNFTVYRKDELPERWHFKNNRRVPPILLVANEGYAFDDVYWGHTQVLNSNVTLGVHGYDNTLDSMHPIFLAWGPRIRKNHTVDPFDSVDLYLLFSTLLDLQAPPTNGSLANVIGILKEDKDQLSKHTVKILAVLAVSVMIMGIAGLITHCLIKRRTTITTAHSYKLLTRTHEDKDTELIVDDSED